MNENEEIRNSDQKTGGSHVVHAAQAVKPVNWEEKAKEHLAELQRAKAEMANIRKDEAKRFAEFSRYAAENMVKKFLPLKDMLDRAVLHIPDAIEESPWTKGVAQVAKAFDAVLGSLGVKPILALGQEYDPKFHEAVEEVSREGVKPHEIVEEVESGYMWEDEMVIRPAKVKVAKGDRNPA